MILRAGSPAGFLGISFLFLATAWMLGRQAGGLQAWFLSSGRRSRRLFTGGLLAGLLSAGIVWGLQLAAGTERATPVPSVRAAVPSAVLLLAGCFLSSLTEDILVRGLLFRYLGARVPPVLFVVLSALLYAGNHIYRLGEPAYMLYAFVLGVQYAVPLVLTRNLSYTIAQHWAGNIVYHISATLFVTVAGPSTLSPLLLAALVQALLLPLHYVLPSRIGRRSNAVRPSSAPIRHSSAFS